MKIKKIIVDEKPKSCKECYFRGVPYTLLIPDIYSCDLLDCDMFCGDNCPLCEEKNNADKENNS